MNDFDIQHHADDYALFYRGEGIGFYSSHDEALDAADRIRERPWNTVAGGLVLLALLVALMVL